MYEKTSFCSFHCSQPLLHVASQNTKQAAAVKMMMMSGLQCGIFVCQTIYEKLHMFM